MSVNAIDADREISGGDIQFGEKLFNQENADSCFIWLWRRSDSPVIPVLDFG